MTSLHLEGRLSSQKRKEKLVQAVTRAYRGLRGSCFLFLRTCPSRGDSRAIDTLKGKVPGTVLAGRNTAKFQDKPDSSCRIPP